MKSPNLYSHTGTLQTSRTVGGKSASLILALFLLIQPLTSVFAEDEATSADAPAEQTQQETTQTETMDSTSADSESVDQTDGSAEVSQEGDSASLPEEENQPQNLNLLSGVAESGSAQDKVENSIQVDDAQGSFNYTYDIETPPGRSGESIDLKLTYNSSSDSRDAVVGKSWRFNIPYIQRLSKKGVNNLYTEDYFISSFDGELVSQGGGIYTPKVEAGALMKYTYSGGVWTILDREGTQYSFGTTSQSRQDDPNNSSHVYTWMLEKKTDTNGNSTAYTYYKNAGQIYPQSIDQDGIVSISFDRATTSASTTSYAPGFKVTNSYRISEIDVTVSSSTAFTYNLTYSSHSLLEEIEKTAPGESTEFSTTFEYVDTSSVTDGWGSTAYISDSFEGNIIPENSKPYLHTDVNGDGLADRVQAYRDGSIWSDVVLSTGSSFDGSGGYSLPEGVWLYEDGGGGNMQLADINGDALPDLITFDTQINYYLNTGSGWSTTTATTSGHYSSEYPDNNSGPFLHVDLNGDGLADQVSAFRDENSDVWNNTSLNIGGGFGDSGGYTLSSDFWLSDDGDSGNVQFADINGDNLPDLVHFGSSDIKYYLNTGGGWATTTYATTGYYSSVTPRNNSSFAHADLNGDGLAEQATAFRESDNDVYNSTTLNTGSGFDGSGFALPSTSWLNDEDAGFGNAQFGDIDGDGLLDLVLYAVDYIKYYHNNARLNPVLTRVTNEYGGEVNIAYSTPQLQNATNDIPFTFPVVASTSRDYLFDNEVTDTYVYNDADFYYLSPFEHRFAGFGSVTKTTDLGKETRYFHQGNSSTASTSEFGDSFSKIGFSYRTEEKSLANALYRVTAQQWEDKRVGTTTSSSSIFVRPIRQMELNYDGDADYKATAVTYEYDATTDVVLEKTEWGEVIATTTPTQFTFTDTGSDKRETTYTYSTSSSAYIFVPRTETVRNQSSTLMSSTRFYYDSLSLSNVTKGNLTKRDRATTTSAFFNEEWSYNQYGLVTQYKNPRNKATTYAYDAQNLYPSTTTNPLSHVTVRTYDYSSGKVATTTNPDGRVSVSVYDGFDRVKEEKIPDPSSGTPVTKATYTYTDTPGAVSVLTKQFLNNGTTTDTYEYFNGFNQKVQSREEVEVSNKFAVRDLVYGDAGLLAEETIPYTLTGSGYSEPTVDSGHYTTYEYDPLGRIVSVDNSAGVTNTAYDQWTETVTDSEDNVKDFSYDAYKRLATTTEHLGTTTYATSYTWDAADNLTKITDALGNVRNITYDFVGRRLTLQDLHASADATYGIWTFVYDDSGNITSSTDPKGQVVNYTYDDLNRPLTENYTGQAGTEITYTYDSCTDGKGKLCQVANGSATTTFTYTPTELPDTESVLIGTTTYATNYDYDRQGNKTQITYPDNSAVQYVYNTAGQLEKITQNESGGAAQIIVADFDYGPHGMVTYQEHGNGVVTERVYNSNKLYRLTSIYTYDTSGGIGGEGEAFGDIQQLLAYAEDGTPFVVIDDIAMPLTISETADYAVDESLPLTEEVGTTTEEIPEPEVEGIIPDILEDDLSTTTDVIIAIEEATTTEIAIVTPDDTSTTTEPVASTTELVIEDALVIQAGVGVPSYLVGVPFTNAGDVKADVILAEASSGTYSMNGYTIAIDRIEKIEGGVQALVRAWHGDSQLGFGPDGTIETERFRIFNPPVLVPDSEGPIQIEYTTPEGEYIERSLREDPEEALHQVLAHDVSLTGKKGTAIEAGTVGSTTSTFYPVTDGFFHMSESQSWDAMHDATSSFSISPTDIFARGYMVSANYYGIERAFTIFDTSAIPETDSISAASTSLWGVTTYDSDNDADAWINVVQATPASSTSVVQDDYDQVGAVNNPVEGSTRKDITTGISTGAYNTWALNATGTTWVNKSGYTNLGWREGHDVADNPYGVSTYTGARFSDSITAGTTQDPMLVVTHSNGAPTAPTTLWVEGAATTTGVTDPTPEFSAIFNDLAADYITSYQIQVSTSTSFSNPYWNSGKDPYTTASTTGGQRSADISYGGSALNPTATYYWRIRFWDSADNAGAFSSAASFVVATTTSGTGISYILYTYDSVGNITKIVERSNTVASATTTYTYDDLYRLTSASTTEAYQNAYAETYGYNAIGNITSKSDVGSYTYAGDTGSLYANPHAATAINGVTYSYDRNGNLATTSAGLTNTWDYRNRLTQSVEGGNTVTYAYDYGGQRVKKANATTTTYYPFGFYEVGGATTTKHVYAGDTLVASLETVGATTTTRHNHVDHLNSTVVMTNSSGGAVQILSYHPFGSMRIDQQYGSADQLNRYTGHDYDEETELSYLGARYYTGDRGQFISQDPVFQAVGDWKTVQEKTGDKLGYYLQNPQTHNSYSYAANNPIRYQDQGGEYLESVVDVAFIAYDLYKVGEAFATGGDYKTEAAYLAADVAGLALPGATGFGLAARIAAKGGDEFAQGAVKVGNLGLDSANTKSVHNTLERIKNGDTSAFKKDGTVWRNDKNQLPKGNYREYTVETPGLNNRGAQRIVHNIDTGEKYYTGDHYKTFKKIKEETD